MIEELEPRRDERETHMETKDDGGARLRAGVTEQVEGAAAEVTALVRQHPVGALAAAAGIGYILGGGLFTRTTSRVFGLAVRLGVRFALMPLIERELSALAGGGISMEGAEGDGADRTHH
jgi:hypothetical protein